MYIDILCRYDVLETVAHELAHQWYGNLVTCSWWDQVGAQDRSIHRICSSQEVLTCSCG